MKSATSTNIAHAISSSLRCLLIALLFAAPALKAEETAAAQRPERVIRDFYRWYVETLLSNRDPFRAPRTELRRYATARLIQQIDRARKSSAGLDADYFLDAQDFDKDWANNITISNAVIKGTNATADVELRGSEVGTRRLRVHLVRTDGAWKVDKIEGK